MEGARAAASQQPALSVKPFPIRLSAAAWRKMASSRSRPGATERLAPRLSAVSRAGGLAAIGSRPGTVARASRDPGDKLVPSTRSLRRAHSPAAHHRPGTSVLGSRRLQNGSDGLDLPPAGATNVPVMRLPRAAAAQRPPHAVSGSAAAAHVPPEVPSLDSVAEAVDPAVELRGGQPSQVLRQLHDLASFSASVAGGDALSGAPHGRHQVAARAKRASWATPDKRPKHPAALMLRDRRSLSSGRGLEDLAAGIASRVPPPLMVVSSGTWGAVGAAGPGSGVPSSAMERQGHERGTARGQSSVPGLEERNDRLEAAGSTVRKPVADGSRRLLSPASRTSALYLAADVSGWADSASPDSQLPEHVMDDLAAEDGGELKIGSLPRTSRSSLGKRSTTPVTGAKTSNVSSTERCSRSIRTIRQLNLGSPSEGSRGRDKEAPSRAATAFSPLPVSLGESASFAPAVEGPERTPLAQRLVAAAEVRSARNRSAGDSDHWLQISSQGGTIRHLAFPKPRIASRRPEPLVSGSKRPHGAVFALPKAAAASSPISCVVVPRAPEQRLL